MRIGIDIGNVIIGGGGEDTFFTDEYLDTPEVEGAYQSIEDIVYGKEKTIIPDPDGGLGSYKIENVIHFISKCGRTVERKSMEWLYQNKYYYLIENHDIHFVRKRHLKAPMAQALELQVFIDDREDVLEHMVGIVPHLILFKSWEQTNAELELIFAEAAKR